MDHVVTRGLRFTFRELLSVFTLILVVQSPSIATTYPYRTRIACGDPSTARLVFGNRASYCETDAVPVFADVQAYQLYYKIIQADACNDQCVSRIYHQLADAGRMEVAIVGDGLIVLGSSPDPEDKSYTICRVRLDHPKHTVDRFMICQALKLQPGDTSSR